MPKEGPPWQRQDRHERKQGRDQPGSGAEREEQLRQKHDRQGDTKEVTLPNTVNAMWKWRITWILIAGSVWRICRYKSC